MNFHSIKYTTDHFEDSNYQVENTHCQEVDFPPKFMACKEANSNNEGAPGISGKYWLFSTRDYNLLMSGDMG